jgi:hypothetical protein
MGKVKSDSLPMGKRSHPASSPEAREKQMISLAVNLAEKQLLDGTASAQVITHYLKLATEKERLEIKKLEEENRLLKAKTKAVDSMDETKRMYEEALEAMKRYSAHGDTDY